MLRWTAALFTGLLCTAAAAQVSTTLALLSDYRFRGVSLSADQAAAQADVGLDHASGAYAGLFASSVRFDRASPTRVEAQAYAGYARRLDDGASIDAGASYAKFPGNNDYSYGEVHAGIAGDGLSASAYYAPDYFGQGVRTFYAECNLTPRLAPGVKAIGHAGALLIASGQQGRGRAHGDARPARVATRRSP